MNTYSPQLPGKKAEAAQATTGRWSPLPSFAPAAPLRANGVAAPAGASELQKAFLQRRGELLTSIDGSRSLLRDLKAAPTLGFAAQYPLRIPSTLSKPPLPDARSQATLAGSRSSDSVAAPRDAAPVADGWASAPGTEAADIDLDDGSPLNVLKVDVKGPAPPTSWMANLLQEKLVEASSYLDRLFNRISDTSSKVFVTGDLNAGKSTFVNALLRREVVPQDQQPCTTSFCEVIDANQNEGREEVHAIVDPEKYNRTDPSTFARYDIRHLDRMVTENAEKHEYTLFKIYCNDKRLPAESLIKNGLVDISLIDSPGLNIDSLKTTANFAKQEDIDVIVFMVHAENQFTLSGKEFLQNAGKEKAHVFIVVNRFDMIEDQERCKRDILEQVRKLSPETYADAKNLVHFVSAKNCMKQSQATGETPADFDQLEKSLRTFVLEKRFQSKLAPAKTYLKNLLTDVEVIAKFNAGLAEERMAKAVKELDEAAPSYNQMLEVKEKVLDDIDKTIDQTSADVQKNTRDNLDGFLSSLEEQTKEVEWRGLLYTFQYARDVRAHLYSTASDRVKEVEQFAVSKSKECISGLQQAITECLPADNAEAAGRPAPDVFEGEAPSSKSAGAGAQANGSAAVVPAAVSLELGDFFDLSDRLELVKEYVPSLTMIASGMYGYTKLADEIMKYGYQGLLNLGRFAFVSLAVAGVGAFIYTLTDMESVLSKKMSRKVRQQFQQMQWVENHVERTGRATRRALRLSIWDLQNRFYRQLDETQKKRSRIEADKEEARKAAEYWKGMVDQTGKLEEAVQRIDVTDHVSSA
ncbi:P-loop containing nucleoside triphosphate hydrolase protein [Hyaloraphidium curvatum]|nr:P-loop containing nucleoside triphosphate hydrolase protein [Hyaloraphidium curvatum]